MNRNPSRRQLHHFLNHDVHRTLTRALPIRSPYRTEGTVFGAASHGLHRRPHIAILRQQIPPRGLEILRFHAAAFIDLPRRITATIFQRLRPDQIAVALDDGMRVPQLQGFLRIERRVNPAKNYKCASLPRHPADRVTAQRVSCVNSDSNCIAGLDPSRIQAFQSLIADLWIAERRGRRPCQHVQPAGGDYRGPKRGIAWIDQMNFQASPLDSCSKRRICNVPKFAWATRSISFRVTAQSTTVRCDRRVTAHAARSVTNL